MPTARGDATVRVILLLALVLRVPGLFTDLWLDEVWSLGAVEPMRSWLGVFTDFKSDNNHHLNSLWLYVVGPGAAAWRYRLLALLGGLASVLFAWLIGRRDSVAAGVAAGLAVAASFPLTLYSSEARGYALLVAAALGCWYFVQRYADEPGWARAWPIWLCAVTGLLSHLTIFYALAGCGAWLIGRRQARRAPARAVAWTLVQALGPALLAAIAIWRFVLRGSVLGGGPPYTLASTLAETLSSALGIVGGGALQAGAAIAIAGLFLESIWRQARQGDDRWVFYAVAVVAAPAFVLGAARPPFLFVRYFSTQVAFVLVAVASTWAARWHTGGASRRVAAVALVAFLGLNMAETRRFWSVGRGGYHQALTAMCAEAGREPVGVASDHDFRNGMLVRYYARSDDLGCRVAYVGHDALARGGAGWFITHTVGDAGNPSADVADAFGRRYRLVRSYPAHELSGMTWHLYRADRPDVDSRPRSSRGPV